MVQMPIYHNSQVYLAEIPLSGKLIVIRNYWISIGGSKARMRDRASYTPAIWSLKPFLLPENR